jgi:hypothetical protein
MTMPPTWAAPTPSDPSDRSDPPATAAAGEQWRPEQWRPEQWRPEQWRLWRPSPKTVKAAGAAIAVIVVAAGALAATGGGLAKPKRANPIIAEQQVAAALLATPPRGYGATTAGSLANGPVDAATAAKAETNPNAAALALQQAGFEGGFARTWTRKSPPSAVVDVGYQFASPAGARRYYDLYVKAQQNKPNTTEFTASGLATADGFTDSTDPALTLQTVVFLSGNRVFVVGVGDPAGQASPDDARRLAVQQAKSAK